MEEYSIEFSFANTEMTKKSLLSMSTSKSFSLRETTITSPSPNTTSNALKAQTFHYSQGSMNKLPDILAMVFPDSKIAGNITLGCAKVSKCY